MRATPGRPGRTARARPSITHPLALPLCPSENETPLKEAGCTGSPAASEEPDFDDDWSASSPPKLPAPGRCSVALLVCVRQQGLRPPIPPSHACQAHQPGAQPAVQGAPRQLLLLLASEGLRGIFDGPAARAYGIDGWGWPWVTRFCFLFYIQHISLYCISHPILLVTPFLVLYRLGNTSAVSLSGHCLYDVFGGELAGGEPLQGPWGFEWAGGIAGSSAAEKRDGMT